MSAPLADRIRPSTLEEVVGQEHLLGEGQMLSRIIRSGADVNMIFYGPPGVGKTTVAQIIAARTGKLMRKLNGTRAGTADIKAIVGELDTLGGFGGILLYLDEIQYLNKKQQQTLLEYIENGSITLIASTTENPYFYVYSAILSRCTVFEFKPVGKEAIAKSLLRAVRLLEEESGAPIELSEEAALGIAAGCGGDVRKALSSLELCALSAPLLEGKRQVSLEDVQAVSQKSAMRYDREGDEHYDILSAFQKSMRGSDPDAALHYLARLLEAGDLPSVCRRLLVCACEDVGLAYPQIIPICKAAVDTALQVGLPEARIPLADAVILVALSPKSNSGESAIDAAMADVQAGKAGPIPRHLQNKHYDSAEVAKKGQFYLYPHEYPNHWTPQQYLPDSLKGARYYDFGPNKNEQAFRQYWERVKGEKR